MTIDLRKTILDSAARLLASADPASAPLVDVAARLGAVVRVACGDDGDPEGAQLVADADALLATGNGALPALAARLTSSPAEAVELPPTPSLGPWLASPRGPFSAALAELDRLGAVTAGLGVLAPGSTAHRQAQSAVDHAAALVSGAALARGGEMLDAAVAAAERIAAEGVAPGADDALLALSDVCGDRLAAALRGEPLEAPRGFHIRSIDADVASQLGARFAKALSRTSPLEVSPDLMELAPQGAGLGHAEGDLVLHGASEASVLEPTAVELLKGVLVKYVGSELEVELAADASVLVVPIFRGEPGDPCPVRSGAHTRHLVFTLSLAADDARGDDLDGYALVVGDRLAFLKRRAA
jgi:hypothetical protein